MNTNGRRAGQYLGKVCAKHPELEGLRYGSGNCVPCSKERAQRWERENAERAKAGRRRRYAAKPSAGQYLGKVCTKHPDLNGLRVRSGCVLCQREHGRRWEHQNRGQINATVRRRYAADPSVGRAVCKRWQAENRPMMAAARARYKASKRAAAVGLTAKDRQRIAEMYAEAARRTRETGIKYHVDHDKPLARGGKHQPDNLLVIPASMNCAKGARYESTMAFILS